MEFDRDNLGPIAIIVAGILIVGAVIWIGLEVSVFKETDHGSVVVKQYTAAYDEWVPESKTCYGYDSNGNCTYESTTYAHWDHHPPSWRVRLRDEKDKEDWFTVDETTYGCLDVGEYFDTKAPENACIPR